MKHALFLAGAVLAAALPAQVVRTVVQNGPSTDLYDIVFLGDGYTAAEQAQFDQDVLDVVNYFRTHPTKFPYGAYFHLYNVHTVFRASNQSGADKPPLNFFVDTAYDASYWTGGTERCLYIGDTALASADAALAPDTDGRVIVLVNDAKYGGCAGTFSVSYNGSSMEDVQAHEWGHSFGRLADEYDYGNTGTYSGPEPSRPNITADPTGAAKWSLWLGHSGLYGTVAAYEGAGTWPLGLFRPEPDCEMRSLNRNFCTICREQIVKRFHQECVVIGAPTPSPVTAAHGDTVQLSFTNRIAARPHAIEWRVDGGAWIPGTETFAWNVGAAPVGPHAVEARLTDLSTAVRSDPAADLVHVHAWRIDVTRGVPDLGLRDVLPVSFADSDGDTTATYPFGVAGPHRAMFAYDRTNTDSPFPVSVTGIAFRPDAGVTSTPGGTVQLTLDVSTARRAPDALSRTFDDNHGADRRRAFDGSITIQAQTFAASPSPFLVTIPFDDPFAWNPRSGPLLLDLRVTTPAPGPALTLDAVTAGAGELAQLRNDSDADATTADFPASGTAPSAPVIELVLGAPVSPDAFDFVEGDAAISLGFGTGVAQRVQQIHDGATFVAAGRHLVTALAWRTDLGQPWPAGRTIDLRVDLSTGPPNLATSASPTYDQNHGPDRVTVFDGPWTPPATDAAGAMPFALRLDLARPFEFDPSRASLVVDVRIRGATGPVGAPIDAVTNAAGLALVWSLGDADAPLGWAVFQTTPVLALLAVPHPVVPESADGVPGGFALALPFGTPGPCRMMSAYDAAALAQTEPVEITHLSWRAASGPTPPSTFRARVDVSTGTTLPLAPVFDTNHGTDRTTVFTGDFSVTRGDTPDFVVEIELDTPFRWDPSNGPLVVDVRKLADVSGGTFDLDAVDGSPALSTIAHAGDANATTANQPVAARAPVLRLGGTVASNALATPYGTGCGRPAGAPVAGSIGLPWPGNADFRFAVFDAAPQAAALIVFGATASSVPLDFLNLPGCALLTDATLGNLIAATDAAGRATSPVSLPEGPALLGFTATTQWVVLDPLGVNGISLSDGLRFEIR